MRKLLSPCFPATSKLLRRSFENEEAGAIGRIPVIWLFLLIVLALMSLVFASVSIFMHLHQSRARRDLQERIAAGLVDLEAIGVKRLTVPQSVLDVLPKVIFWGNGSSSVGSADGTIQRKNYLPESAAVSKEPEKTDKEISELEESMKHSTASSDNGKCLPFNQSTCAICLDLFIKNVTLVRELPCRHIFHPQCIDVYLLSRSSLCPLCKRSVLPKGHLIPESQLTNATVYRERQIRHEQERRMREHARQHRTDSLGSPNLSVHDRSWTTSPGRVAEARLSDSMILTHQDEMRWLHDQPWRKRILYSIFPGMQTRAMNRYLRRTRSSSDSHV